MAARLAVGETRPPGERPGLGTSMELAALAWRPNQLAIDPPAAAMVKLRGSDSALAALRRGHSAELTIVRSDSRIINERKGNSTTIIIVVEDGDDIEFAQQIAEDIPHQTFSVADIPIEVRTAQHSG